jgi:hypothetical protein
VRGERVELDVVDAHGRGDDEDADDAAEGEPDADDDTVGDHHRDDPGDDADDHR